MTHDPMVRPKAAMELLGVKRTTLHRMVKSGALPAPIKISQRAVGWRRSVLEGYLDGLKKAA